MPGDPLKHVVTGEKFQPQARTWNTFVDTSKWVQSRQIAIDRGLIRDSDTPGIILVKNESGSTVERFHALGLDEPIILPSANLNEFYNRVAYRGVTPTSSHEGKWALLLEPLADGKIGRAAVSGVFPALVTFSDADEHTIFRFAEPSGGTGLVASGHGAAEILWASGSGTGELKCHVRIGPWQTDELFGKLDGDLASGSTATVSLWTPYFGADSGVDLAGVKPWGTLAETIPSGKEVMVRRMGGSWGAVRAQC